MDFGLFSQHHRPSRGVADAYEEDLVEVVTADQLGYREAWISEHAFGAQVEGRLRSLRLFMEQVAPGLGDLAPPATELAEAGVAGGGLQAERGGELFGTEPDAARKRGPGAAVEGQPRP